MWLQQQRGDRQEYADNKLSYKDCIPGTRCMVYQ